MLNQSQGRWSALSVLERERQEDTEFEAILGYIASPRSVWATQQDCVSEKERKTYNSGDNTLTRHHMLPNHHPKEKGRGRGKEDGRHARSCIPFTLALGKHRHADL